MVFFDDAAQDFDLKSLYSRTTGRFTVNKKHRDSFVIPCEDAPKMVITSNYAIADDDPSTQRRNYQVEVSDFYKSQREEYGYDIKDFHGQKLSQKKVVGMTKTGLTSTPLLLTVLPFTSVMVFLPSQKRAHLQAEPLVLTLHSREPRSTSDHFIQELNAAVARSGSLCRALLSDYTGTVRISRTNHQYDLVGWFKAVGKAFGMNPNQHYRNGNQSSNACW